MPKTEKELIEQIAEKVDGIVLRSGSISQDSFYEEINKITALCKSHYINQTVDKAKAMTFEEPEYIANSQEHHRGYSKALDNMGIALETLRHGSE